MSSEESENETTGKRSFGTIFDQNLSFNTRQSFFWERFEHEISQTAPIIRDTTLILMEEIKSKLISVMTSNVKKLKIEIMSFLNKKKIKKEIKIGIFDWKVYARFIVWTMKKICAPIRDEKIVEISKRENPSAIFRGILETLDSMKVDLINYTLAIKPSDGAKLEYISRYGDDFSITKEWLKNQKSNSSIKDIMTEAYLDLLTWTGEYPETLINDQKMLIYIKNEYFKIMMASSIVFIVYTFVPVKLEITNTIKNLISLLNAENFKLIIPDIVEHLKRDLNKTLGENDKAFLSEFELDGLTSQLESLTFQGNRVVSIVEKRMRDFFKSVLREKKNFEIATSLGFVKEELSSLASQFAFIVERNFRLFFPKYASLTDSVPQ